MIDLLHDDYLQVLQVTNRLARNGLTIMRFEAGQRFPHFEWANDVTLERTKFSEDELLAYPSPFFAHAPNAAFASQAYARALRRDGSPFEVHIASSDGERYWIEAVCAELTPAKNGALRCVVAGYPIERQKAYERLAQLLADAVNSQPDSVLIVHPNLERPLAAPVTYVNAAFTAQTGYTMSDFRASRYPNLIRHAEDRAKIIALAKDLLAGHNIVTEIRIARADGSEYWAELRAHPMQLPVSHVVTVITDISNRRMEQERMTLLSEAVSNASDFVIVTDVVPPSAGGPSIVYVNRSFLDATGFTEAELIGRRYLSIFSEKNPATLSNAITATIESGESNYREALIQRKDGTHLWAEIVERPFKTEVGRELRLHVSRDITLRRRSSSQLSMLLAAVEQAPTPIVIYEPHDNELEVVYENGAASRSGFYHLLDLWKGEAPDVRERILSGEDVTTTYTQVRANGDLAMARVATNVIRTGTHVDAILTQEFYLEGNDLLAALPSISRGRTLEERVDALRILLRTAFDADLHLSQDRALPGAVRIDEPSRVATFELAGHLARVSWGHALEARSLTALRLCIETAIDV